jgi:hypothetical protein
MCGDMPGANAMEVPTLGCQTNGANQSPIKDASTKVVLGAK